MLSCKMALVQDANFVTVGANANGPACQGWWHRVAIAVELDPRGRSDNRRHDLIGIEGDSRQRTQQRPLFLEAVYRSFLGCFVYPHIGDLVAPRRSKCQVVLEADEFTGRVRPGHCA